MISIDYPPQTHGQRQSQPQTIVYETSRYLAMPGLVHSTPVHVTKSMWQQPDPVQSWSSSLPGPYQDCQDQPSLRRELPHLNYSA